MTNATCSVDTCEKSSRSSGFCGAHEARNYRYGSPTGAPKRLTIHERALAKTVRLDGCWKWTGYHDPKGYGRLRDETGNHAAYRLVYEALVGPIPQGNVLDHMCHNPACVNPEHLRPVTNQENVQNFTTRVRSHNTSGFRGVCLHKPSGLWQARAKSGGRVICTYHKTKEEAADAARKHRLAIHTHNDADRMSIVRGV